MLSETATIRAGNTRSDIVVSILTVGFQSRDFIETCFSSVYETHPYDDFEILFVDNGDGMTEALVRERFPQVRVVPSAGNIGFGAGNNLLARQARGRYLLLLNPDAHFIDDGISNLLRFARENPDASIWGGRTLDGQLRPDVVDGLRFPTLSNLAKVAFWRDDRVSPPSSGDGACKEVEVVCGGFLLIDRAAWDEAGGFDESFFLYSEEVDLMYRLHCGGHRFLATDRARVVHEVGGADNLSPRRQMYKAIGAMHYYRKHWVGPRAALAGVFFWIAALKRVLGGLVLAWRSPRMGKLVKAFAPIVLKPWTWWHGYN